MKITIIYDNYKYKCYKCIKDHGFSAFIEIDNKKILFDTGTKGEILLNNFNNLNINYKDIDIIFISHIHYDHIGGLKTLLENLNKKIKIYLPFNGYKEYKDIENAIFIKDITEIENNIYSSGQLKDIEQSLFIKTKKGLIILVGCSHPGLENIIDTAKKLDNIHLIIGGLHGFNKFDKLIDTNYIAPSHCTKFIDKIKQLYPEKYIKSGIGKIFEI